MKRLLSFTILASLFLTGCGLTVIDSATLSEYPELKPVAKSWQGIVGAVEEENCEELMTYMRHALDFEETHCDVVYRYFDENEVNIDWSLTQWNGDGTKVKLYLEGKRSFTSLIDTAEEGTWQISEDFWSDFD